MTARKKTTISKWVFEEDRQLLRCIKKYGTNRWNLVSRWVGTRSVKQCQRRWSHIVTYLGPQVLNYVHVIESDSEEGNGPSTETSRQAQRGLLTSDVGTEARLTTTASTSNSSMGQVLIHTPNVRSQQSKNKREIDQVHTLEPSAMAEPVAYNVVPIKRRKYGTSADKLPTTKSSTASVPSASIVNTNNVPTPTDATATQSNLMTTLQFDSAWQHPYYIGVVETLIGAFNDTSSAWGQLQQCLVSHMLGLPARWPSQSPSMTNMYSMDAVCDSIFTVLRSQIKPCTTSFPTATLETPTSEPACHSQGLQHGGFIEEAIELASNNLLMGACGSDFLANTLSDANGSTLSFTPTSASDTDTFPFIPTSAGEISAVDLNSQLDPPIWSLSTDIVPWPPSTPVVVPVPTGAEESNSLDISFDSAGQSPESMGLLPFTTQNGMLLTLDTALPVTPSENITTLAHQPTTTNIPDGGDDEDDGDYQENDDEDDEDDEDEDEEDELASFGDTEAEEDNDDDDDDLEDGTRPEGGESNSLDRLLKQSIISNNLEGPGCPLLLSNSSPDAPLDTNVKLESQPTISNYIVGGDASANSMNDPTAWIPLSGPSLPVPADSAKFIPSPPEEPTETCPLAKVDQALTSLSHADTPPVISTVYPAAWNSALDNPDDELQVYLKFLQSLQQGDSPIMMASSISKGSASYADERLVSLNTDRMNVNGVNENGSGFTGSGLTPGLSSEATTRTSLTSTATSQHPVASGSHSAISKNPDDDLADPTDDEEYTLSVQPRTREIQEEFRRDYGAYISHGEYAELYRDALMDLSGDIDQMELIEEPSTIMLFTPTQMQRLRRQQLQNFQIVTQSLVMEVATQGRLTHAARHWKHRMEDMCQFDAYAQQHSTGDLVSFFHVPGCEIVTQYANKYVDAIIQVQASIERNSIESAKEDSVLLLTSSEGESLQEFQREFRKPRRRRAKVKETDTFQVRPVWEAQPPDPLPLPGFITEFLRACIPIFDPQCWPQILSAKYKSRVTFFDAEDRLLLYGLRYFGTDDYNSIRSHFLPTKSNKQIENRVANLKARQRESNPVKTFMLLQIKPFTLEEEELLRHAVKIYGRRFKIMSREVIRHRPSFALRSAWANLTRKHNRLKFRPGGLAPWNARSALTFSSGNNLRAPWGLGITSGTQLSKSNAWSTPLRPLPSNLTSTLSQTTSTSHRTTQTLTEGSVNPVVGSSGPGSLSPVLAARPGNSVITTPNRQSSSYTGKSLGFKPLLPKSLLKSE
ncbi:hypothetical protein IWQ61_009591 [Dispira simplex]|nr:hypothetical protein IWQ61_009591 [Dispira simplex]